ncbi:MAG: WYL domain-containing protein [Rhodoferax sp.]|nr:WYL domain-containing protein [Rhodoferax sp.]
MGSLERLRQLDRVLASGRGHSTAELAARLEVSRSTIKRDLQYLSDRLGVPVRRSIEHGGWIVDRADSGSAVELPGLWLTAEEIRSLLAMQQWLTSLDAGALIRPHVAPLTRRLARILDSGVPPRSDVARRIRIVTHGARRLQLPCLRTVGDALLQRQRLRISYGARSTSQASDREVSPQRLVHYRDNWYLDAWCHLRDALRSFSVDAIEHAQRLDAPAIEMDEAALDDELGAGYGIYAGSELRHAVLRFSAASARWVAAERWHPNQIGRRDADGRWLLTVPYSDPRELVMDVLRHVPEVEVLATDELRHEVVQRLRQGLRTMGLDE